MELCEVAGCELKVMKETYCVNHYRMWRKHGDPLIRKNLKNATTAERLEAYVDRSGGPDACWPWTRCTNPDGYGRMHNKEGGSSLSHRVVMEQVHNGPIDRSLDVMHLCNNRRCCNPAHLKIGTRAENQNYMMNTGRSASGERNAMAKLTQADVDEIRKLRAAGWKQRELAVRFGVGVGAISKIELGQRWAPKTL